jgi:hypothetical protein
MRKKHYSIKNDDIYKLEKNSTNTIQRKPIKETENLEDLQVLHHPPSKIPACKLHVHRGAGRGHKQNA